MRTTTKGQDMSSTMIDTNEFDAWMGDVDKVLTVYVGVTHRDLADWSWSDAFEDGASPVEAARQAWVSEFGSSW